MADYINSNILSQSYVHVEPEWLASISGKVKQEEIEKIKEIITTHAKERMKFFLYDNVDIEVVFEDGSIKAKITAYGHIGVFLLALGHGITNYPEYSNGIRAIVTDVAKTSELVNSEILFQTKSKHKHEIIRIEARKGVIGSLHNINKKINSISDKTKNHKDNDPSLIYQMILDLHEDILSLMDKINDKNDKELIRTSLMDGVKNINLKVGVFDLSDPAAKPIHFEILKERTKLVKNLQDYK